MPKSNIKILQHFQDQIHTMKPEEKLHFLDTTMLRVSKNSKKAISKKKEKVTKCPVYKCNREVASDGALKAHYKEAHKDLIDLGLDIISSQGGQGGGSQGVKGRISNTLLSQLMICCFSNRDAVRKIMKEVNEEGGSKQ